MTTSESYAVDAAARPFLHGRFEEAFPALTDAQIARIRRFGTARRFAGGELLFEAGGPRSGMYIVLSGHIAITARDGPGRITPIVDQGPGQFIAELGTLADDATSLTDGRAEGNVEALLIPSEKIRTLIVEEAELGERIMRALVFPRFALVELGEGGPLVIGAAASRDVVRLEDFLRRNGHPHRLLDPAVDPAAAEVVARLAPAPSGLFCVLLEDGRRVRARTVVVATGARYRRPAIDNLAAFEGRGVWYWASPFEAKLCARQEVIIVGGGNSAGQAAVFLAGHAAKVRMMVRGPGLAASMSRYLIQRITATSNIEVMTETEIVALEGSPELGLERVRWRSRRDDGETTAPIGNVFLFLGADPATSWLTGCGVALDPHGFVVTATGGSPLASSVPGVFAVGDVRLGSVKRVGQRDRRRRAGGRRAPLVSRGRDSRLTHHDRAPWPIRSRWSGASRCAAIRPPGRRVARLAARANFRA